MVSLVNHASHAYKIKDHSSRYDVRSRVTRIIRVQSCVILKILGPSRVTQKTLSHPRKLAKARAKKKIALWGREIEDNLERADNTTRRIQDAIKAIDLGRQVREAIEKHKKNMKF